MSLGANGSPGGLHGLGALSGVPRLVLQADQARTLLTKTTVMVVVAIAV
jgi:hypothetical protein